MATGSAESTAPTAVPNESAGLGTAGDGASAAAGVRAGLEAFQPQWEQPALKHLSLGDLVKSKALMATHIEVVGILLETLAKLEEEDDKARWIATLLHDMLREDAGCYGLYEEALKAKAPIYSTLVTVISRQRVDGSSSSYIADRSAWILTAVVGSSPSYFSPEQVDNIVTVLKDSKSVSKLGFLEAVTNLLKASALRKLVWSNAAVQEAVLCVDLQAPASELYKGLFAIWMLSYGADTMADLQDRQIVTKIKAILTTSRVEKVARLCLMVIRSFLEGTVETRELESRKQLCEDMVEQGVLEAVQQLEYEKWRDQELYDEIRDVGSLLSSKVSEFSNFARYKKELDTGKLIRDELAELKRDGRASASISPCAGQGRASASASRRAAGSRRGSAS